MLMWSVHFTAGHTLQNKEDCTRHATLNQVGLQTVLLRELLIRRACFCVVCVCVVEVGRGRVKSPSRRLCCTSLEDLSSSMSSSALGVKGNELDALEPLACTVEARLLLDLADTGLLARLSLEFSSTPSSWPACHLPMNGRLSADICFCIYCQLTLSQSSSRYGSLCCLRGKILSNPGPFLSSHSQIYGPLSGATYWPLSL